MKKLLIATAAMAVVAGAQAQSSVTLYGVLDHAFVNAKTDGSTGDTTQNSGTNATSIIGLSGSEDLGGGLKAIFDLQGDLAVTTGKFGSNATTTTATSDTLFNRQAWVGISSATLGTIKLGRMSDVVDSTEGFANFTQVFDTETAGANGIGGKNANSVRYDSPVIGGVSVAASHSTDAVGNDGTTNSGNTVTTYGINFVKGALTVGASAGRANVDGDADEGKVSTVYAGYNFGVADVRAQYTVDETAALVKVKTKEVSAAVPLAMLGANVKAIVHYEIGDSSTDSADYKQYGLVLTKDLSKRTTIYAGYKLKNIDQGTNNDVTTTAVGVTHKF
jgi:general bacterial porin, GBP family